MVYDPFSSSFGMPHPWNWETNWVEEGAEYYNVTPSSPDFDDYKETVKAYYYNSLGFPTEVGLFVLGLFSACVFLVAAKRCVNVLPSVHRSLLRSTLCKSISSQITQAPLVNKKHMQPVRLLGPFVTLQLPLRADALCIFILALINLLSVVALYRPFRRNNLYWPDSYSEYLRYVSDRSGVVATMQFPLLFLLSGRNNMVTWLTGASFEKCMLYHRWIARFVFVQVVIHAIGYSMIYAQGDYYSTMFDDPYMRWGTAATVAFGPLIFLSLRWLRQQAYEVFVAVHIAMAVVCVIGTYYHIQLLNVEVAGQYNDFIYVIYASVAFWSFDKLVRVARIVRYSFSFRGSSKRLSVSRAQFSVVCTTQRGVIVRHVVHVATTNVNAAGRFVQLWLPKVEPFTSHPFTVADVQTDAEGTSSIYLYSKVHRGATTKLLKRLTNDADKKELALIEGFYGHVPEVDFYDDVILASAGIGITLSMPLFKQRIENGLSAHMVWVIPEHDLLAVLVDMLKRVSAPSDLNKKDDEAVELSARAITVYVTQKTNANGDESVDSSVNADDVAVLDGDTQRTPTMPTQTEQLTEQKQETADPRTELERLASLTGIYLRIVDMHGRRPDLHALIGDVVCSTTAAKANDKRRQRCLISCGPDTFCDDSRRACRTYGLHYFEEAFEW